MPTKTAILVPETVDEVEALIEENAAEAAFATAVGAIHVLIIAPLTTKDARHPHTRHVLAQIPHIPRLMLHLIDLHPAAPLALHLRSTIIEDLIIRGLALVVTGETFLLDLWIEKTMPSGETSLHPVLHRNGKEPEALLLETLAAPFLHAGALTTN